MKKALFIGLFGILILVGFSYLNLGKAEAGY